VRDGSGEMNRKVASVEVRAKLNLAKRASVAK
jgi:hypothetical protein